jgi:hypothetical protein
VQGSVSCEASQEGEKTENQERERERQEKKEVSESNYHL